jgi:sulfane dehydrogenase subunit SoxC
MDDCIVAYGQNGEPLRPQQGFPVRIMFPGFEGIYHTKFLRRIKVTNEFYMNYNEFGHLRPEDKELALGEQIGPKSVITYPSGTQRLPGPGFYEISGLAWSGGGAVKTVEVSTDGGKKWNRARVQEHSAAHGARPVRLPNGSGMEPSRDHVALHRRDRAEQALRREIANWWKVPFERDYRVPGLDNSIMPWKIAGTGV